MRYALVRLEPQQIDTLINLLEQEEQTRRIRIDEKVEMYGESCYPRRLDDEERLDYIVAIRGELCKHLI